MIKFENVVTPSSEQWKITILGARNAYNSWNKSDSCFCEEDCTHAYKNTESAKECNNGDFGFCIGKNDYSLLMRLRNAGTDHRKFMRMLVVYVDVTAPRFWWEQFSTYRVGVVQNSTSTMNKIHSKPIELSDFNIDDFYMPDCGLDLKDMFINVVADCENLRKLYLETNDKKYWRGLIQLLPQSYNQKRTLMLNYEVLANIYKSRKDHKLDCWVSFCNDFIKSLPYSELITGEEANNE